MDRIRHPLLVVLMGLVALMPLPSPVEAKGARSGTSKPLPTRQYDSHGRYLGRTDLTSGRMYDSQGRYLGKTDNTGRFYDAQGVHTGRIDTAGRIYSPQGVYQGRVDSDGRQYDAQGRYTGRLSADNNTAMLQGRGAMEPARTRAVQVEQNRRLSPSVFCNHGEPGCDSD